MSFKVKCFLLFVLGMFVLPLNIRAECDYQRLADLSMIASNVKFNYSYVLNEDGEPDFTVNITNIPNDIYVIDMFGNEYRGNDNTASPYAINYYIYSNDVNCPGLILKKSYSVPSFNYYSKLDVCVGNGSVYCNLWYDTSSFSEEEFRNLVEKKVATSNEETIVESKNYTFVYVITIILILAIICIIIYIIIRKRKIK